MGKKALIMRLSAVLFAILALCTIVSTAVHQWMLPQVSTVLAGGGYVEHITTATGAMAYAGALEYKAGGDWVILNVAAQPDAQVAEGDVLFTVDVEEQRLAALDLLLAAQRAQNAYNRAVDAGRADGAALAELELQNAVAWGRYNRAAASYPKDGKVLSPAQGVLVGFTLAAGDRVAEGAVLFSISPAEVPMMVEFRLPGEEGGLIGPGVDVNVRYAVAGEAGRGGQASVTEREETVSVETQEYDAGTGEWVFTAPIETVPGERPVVPQNAVPVRITHSGVMHNEVVPFACLEPSGEGDGATVYVLNEREGLFGLETYVTALEVEVVDENGLSAAVRSPVSLHGSVTVLATNPSKPLTDGAQVVVRDGEAT